MINQTPLYLDPPEPLPTPAPTPLRPMPSPLPQFRNPTPHVPRKLDYIV